MQLTSGNKVHIIKHWWLHNKWKKYLKSNYFKAINQFYMRLAVPTKERKEEKEPKRSKGRASYKDNNKDKNNLFF